MRFVVAVDDDWTVRVSPDGGEPWPERKLRRLPTARGTFPAPPLEELSAGHLAACELCRTDDGGVDALAGAYRKVTTRTVAGDDVERFGHYLFQTLLGEAAWERVTTAAAAASAALVELALTWPAGERDLHRLNWEMMRGPDGFLAAGGARRSVAITRMVPVPADTPAPERLDLPPRVLFVVGTWLTDPRIRPGAEYLGLLRQLRVQRRGIHARLLQQARPRRVGEVVAEFEPDVVHFICHGGVDNTGRGFLELTPDDSDQAGDPRRYGEQLADLLSTGARRPRIVVLSACYSAATEQARLLGAHETAPLAAELVARGIPVVVGMAGRVSDLACRLFTRRFGAALVDGAPLVSAVAQARRAGFVEGAPPHRTTDWALPAVFLAANVPTDYAPVKPSSGDPAEQVADLISDWRMERAPVFSGREKLLDAYHRLLEPGGPGVLAVYVQTTTPGYGRTRLLEELTAQALRDGNAPILLTVEGAQPPADVKGLGAVLRGGIARTRRLLGLEQDTSQLAMLMRFRPDEGPDDRLDGYISELLATSPVVTAELVGVALKRDLAAVAAAARAGSPGRRGGRVIVLMDDVDRYEEAIEPLFTELLSRSGLGTAEEPAPVALTFSLGGATDHVLRPIWEKRAKYPWIEFAELDVFAPDGEDMLAYEHILLHPFDPTLLPGVSDRPLALNTDVPDDVRDKWIRRFRTRLQGLPGRIVGDRLYALAEDAADDQFVIDADDEVWLRKVGGEQP
jgi:hypothetical protein